MSHDLNDLLGQAMPRFSGSPDLEAIERAARRRRVGRGATGLAGLVAALLVGATVLSPGDQGPIIDQPDPVESSEDARDEVPEAEVLSGPQVIDPDIRLIEEGPNAVPLPDGSLALFDVPEGYTASFGMVFMQGRYLTGDQRDVRAVGVSPAGGLPGDACDWVGNMVGGWGPSVDDFVAGLRALHPGASEPSTVVLDGIPAVTLDIQIDPDLDMETCGDDRGIRRYFLYNLQPGIGRWISGPGQHFRLWVFEVGGERLVMEASWMAQATQEEIDEALELAASVEFITREEFEERYPPRS